MIPPLGGDTFTFNVYVSNGGGGTGSGGGAGSGSGIGVGLGLGVGVGEGKGLIGTDVEVPQPIRVNTMQSDNTIKTARFFICGLTSSLDIMPLQRL